MKKYIVITSIFEPTEAVFSFSKKSDYQLIVVADKKTPAGWTCENVDFVSMGIQEQSIFGLSKVLPYNHYSRKMLGYLSAIKSGAEMIVDTDDDNIPYEDWVFPQWSGSFDAVNEDKGFVNIYQLYTDQKIWPRGLPLKLINTDFALGNSVSTRGCNVGIWQGLADEDPDVDAIYRLTNDQPCYFKKRAPIVLSKGTVCPFNTQNTLIRKELFPLMYLPTYVTFRFTDILRGLVAQPIMWLYGYELGFTQATVIQKRNPHDYMKDFISEIPMYEHCEKVIDLVAGSISVSKEIGDNLHSAYTALHDAGIVKTNELTTLEAWLKDLQHISE